MSYVGREKLPQMHLLESIMEVMAIALAEMRCSIKAESVFSNLSKNGHLLKRKKTGFHKPHSILKVDKLFLI